MISSNDSQMIGKNWPTQLQSVKWVKPMKFYGNSDDEKPVGAQIPNGSKFLEIDTGTQYRYDSENEEWFEQPGAGGSGGSSTLVGLTDVDISNPTDGQTLVYDATSGKWENGSAGDSIYRIIESVDKTVQMTIDPHGGSSGFIPADIPGSEYPEPFWLKNVKIVIGDIENNIPVWDAEADEIVELLAPEGYEAHGFITFWFDPNSIGYPAFAVEVLESEAHPAITSISASFETYTYTETFMRLYNQRQA